MSEQLREPTCEGGRHRGAWRRKRWRNNRRLERMEMEMGRHELKWVQKLKVSRHDFELLLMRITWSMKHEAWRNTELDLQLLGISVTTPNAHHCVELMVFIKSEVPRGTNVFPARSTTLLWAMGTFIQNACEQWIIYCAFYFPLTGRKSELKKEVTGTRPSKCCANLTPAGF